MTCKLTYMSASMLASKYSLHYFSTYSFPVFLEFNGLNWVGTGVQSFLGRGRELDIC